MNPQTNTPAPPKIAMSGYVSGLLSQCFLFSAHLMDGVYILDEKQMTEDEC